MDEDQRLSRIEAKIDDTNDHLASIDVTLGAQHMSLKDHMRRTAILEKELAPVRVHINRVEGAIKLITLIATIAAIIEFLVRK